MDLTLRLGAAAADELLGALAALHRSGPGGLRACRPLFADLLGWPSGALETCAAVERDFPDWVVWHYPASMSWPDAWAAVRETGIGAPLSARTPELLRAEIAAAAPYESKGCAMSEPDAREIAERVADVLARYGVFIEADGIGALTVALRPFLPGPAPGGDPGPAAR